MKDLEARSDRIIKGKDVITCGNEDCVVYGEFYWCYKNQNEDCGIYKR